MKAGVYNMDCMEAMKAFPDGFFDLAVVDPPYGIGEDGSKNHTRGKIAKSRDYKAFHGNDLSAPSQDYFNELLRISKHQIIWGANHFVSKIPFDSSCWIVWDKDNGETDFADCELAWTNYKTAVRKFQWRWQGMLQQNMKNKEQRVHPTQKPVKLYEWIYMNYLPKGGKVLDTHLGSGSNRIAADKQGNIEFYGYEIDKEYFDASVKRYNEFKAQLTMF
jgi:site-specific DNA-methyltransferase (adenine-specific)